MEEYLFTARSITHGQRMRSVLYAAGIPSQLERAPLELSRLGCAYALSLSVSDYPNARSILHRARLMPLRIYLRRGSRYEEVPL